MSAVADFEKKFGVDPISDDYLFDLYEESEEILVNATGSTPETDDARLFLFLIDKIHEHADAADKIPTEFRCWWCFSTGPKTEEAWAGLQKMPVDAMIDHVSACRHNPMVNRIIDLETQYPDTNSREDKP